MNAPIKFCLDSSGHLRIGKANILLDDVVAYHRSNPRLEALIDRFPQLTEEELVAASEYFNSEGNDLPPHSSNARDSQWQRWNTVAAQEMGTDLPTERPA